MKPNSLPLLTTENAPNTLKIINLRHPEWGAQPFWYQAKPIPYKKNKFNHLVGPSYDTKVLYERNFRLWTVSAFKTPEMLEAFKLFQASKKTVTIGEHLKQLKIEHEAELFEEIEVVHYYQYGDQTAEIFQVKEGERWEYYSMMATWCRYSFGVEQDEIICDHNNLEIVEWAAFYHYAESNFTQGED
jgi:hypothetical protein